MVKGSVLAAAEGIAATLTRQSALFFFGLRWHDCGCDSDVLFLKAIKSAIPNVGLGGIRFSRAERSISDDRLQNAHLNGQSVRCNCRGPSDV